MSELLDLTAFPHDFLWGTATSAYQVEGAVAEDGRSPSIWDTFSHTPGKVAGDDHGDVACDHYHRWRQDIGLMKRLGTNAYRLSIAWPRVMPGGDGPVNAKGLAFYDELIDGLLEAGITPSVTLYHWDLPQVLQDRGGWPERDTAEHFAAYASVVADRLGDRVHHWTTLNEPLCSAWIGHLEGVMAPGLTDLTAAVRASYHLLLGHGLAAQAIRAAAPRAEVGIVNNLNTVQAATDRPEDQAAARRMDGHTNRWWLDPVHGRGFPADMREVYGVELPERPGDLDTIAAPLDWLGLNYYFPATVTDDPTGPAPHARAVRRPDVPRTGMDWEVDADGIESLLLRLTGEYGARKLYVTENGSAYPDVVRPDGTVDDPERQDYLVQHLAACASAVRKGAPLAGYFAWSLLDNFEWAYGYDKRFGLVHVDYRTQVRTIKGTGHRYAEIIRDQRGRARRAA
ncbi:GH1 family beta-glucosidase [Streptomyces rapamycinicus]|uniref:Beta-glucosidase n=2 Tax=Streptomyces rapamycinicus TaxID=1226757 RepID=A0A0A0N9S0_STRRN|nr:GH1 family beta-glucosidase [Streptomyces rapamycinicus]AGP52848.1 beta-glucosidase [Streptomyces rapamycinicus NRRL 5491]MBB4780324.1 beta-glucosidase [Streptomyces rapamycinicus]RLV75021.1 beta-glucosidase [Streptomyces rapamycinicus NRRL 5491]UTO61057.1 beta-glucosidase [Streptomyces rapamycinicus]UTP29001.1 beta-glucosidase [Streptomyces rapamycinicus NRRL 5491]